MNQELWKTVWDVSQRARSLPLAERPAFIQANCPDPSVSAEVEALLAEPSVDPSSNPPTGQQPEPLELQSGSRIGRYTITGLLGRGAMGDTFRAHDEGLGRSVAIKILRAWHGEDEAWQRSIREARAASALNHPNIVMVFDVLPLDTGGAIVMELVSGRTLRHWCSQAQPVAKVAHIGHQLALALDAAHTAGIIHRDVKPENVMVRDDGYVKLLDFGLARPVSEVSSNTRGIGTLQYMSPEQACSQRLTPATDVFSLGIILFELLTGAHPFGGKSHLETLSNIVSGKPLELGVLGSNAPVPLKDLIGRMLARKPEDRPQAQEVVVVLAALAGPAPAPLNRPVWPRVAAVASLAAIGVAAATWALRVPPAELPKFYQLTNFTEDRYVTSGAISPDGRQMLFMDVEGDVRLRDIHGEGDRVVTRLPNTQPDQMNWIAQTGKVLLNSLDLSKDSYAFQLSILDPQTGSRTILPFSGKRARPSPDGRRIAYLTADRSEIWVRDLDGHSARRLAADRPGSSAWVEWSADGRRIHSYGAKQALGPTYQWKGAGWRTVDVETGIMLGEQPTEELWPGYMQATGRLLLIRGGNGGLAEVSLDERGRFTQPPQKVADRQITGWLSASTGGRRIAAIDFTKGRAMIHVAETQPGHPRIVKRRRLTAELSQQYAHAWTPDSQGVIFESSARGRPFQIYVQRLDAPSPQALSPSQEHQVLPSVSPDGRWVLFLSGSSSKNRYIRRAPIAGGESQSVPTGSPALDFACLYKAKRCVLREIQNGQAVFHELDPVAGKGRELSRVAVTDWVFGDWSLSPDGKMVAFADSSKAPAVLRIVYLEQPPLEKSVRVEGPAPMGLPVWTAAGDGWYVPTQDYQLRLIGWDGRNRFVHDIGDFAIPSGDGKRIAFLDHVRDQNVWILER